jgi:hypothetical protein
MRPSINPSRSIIGTDYRVVGVLRDLPQNTDLGTRSIFTSWATMTSDSTNGMVKNWGGIQGGTHCFVLFREGYSASNLEAAFPAFRDKYFHPKCGSGGTMPCRCRPRILTQTMDLAPTKNTSLRWRLSGCFCSSRPALILSIWLLPSPESRPRSRGAKNDGQYKRATFLAVYGRNGYNRGVFCWDWIVFGATWNAVFEQPRRDGLTI